MVPKKVAGDLAAARRVNAGTDRARRAGRLRRLARAQEAQPQSRRPDHRRSLDQSPWRRPASSSRPKGAKTKLHAAHLDLDAVGGDPGRQGAGHARRRGAAATTSSRTASACRSPRASPARPRPPSPTARRPSRRRTRTRTSPPPPLPPRTSRPKTALPPQIKTAAQPINVVVVADTDILEDRFWVQVQDFFGQRVEMPVANNGDFVANAVDVLAGGNDLIGLRSRGTSARPFELVDNIQRAADERYQATAKDARGQAQGHPGRRSRSCSDKEKHRRRDAGGERGADARQFPHRDDPHAPAAAPGAARRARGHRPA